MEATSGIVYPTVILQSNDTYQVHVMYHTVVNEQCVVPVLAEFVSVGAQEVRSQKRTMQGGEYWVGRSARCPGTCLDFIEG